MADNLVIVESPAKAKTIEKYLGSDYKVASSFGHISDLPIKELGVHNVSVKLHPEVQATISVIISRTDAEAEILLKGDEINIENNEDLTEEGVINIEEVFEDGAVPENIGEEIEDSSEKVEDKKDEKDAEEFNNEIITETNNPEKEEEDNS